jgi:hypothetical protein
MKRIITILLVLAVCGCIGSSGIFLPGQSKKVKELPSDVIVVQSIQQLPNIPINAGDDFSVSFEVTNLEEQRYVDYVAYSLLDSGLCTVTSPTTNTIPTGVFTTGGQVFLPKQVEFVQWTFNTPKAEDLAYIGSKCPIRFNVTYSFTAISDTDVDVITDAKYDQMQQSGSFSTYVPTLSMGRGPIKINLTFGSVLPIRVGSSLPVYVTVEDKGAGLYSEIPDQALKIYIPNGFSTISCGDRFSCSSGSVSSICSNNQKILMINRKSPPFRCTFTTPTVTSEKVFNIEANLTYNYTINSQVDVKINSPSGV